MSINDVRNYSSGDSPLHYSGGNDIPGLSHRSDLIRENNMGESYKVNKSINNNEDILFMPTDVQERHPYINRVATYSLILFGATADGAKTQVNINSIPIFFDVFKPVKVRSDIDFITILRTKLRFNNIPYDSIKEKLVKRLNGYSESSEKSICYRIYFKSLMNRTSALEVCSMFETASDDKFHYYRKVAREIELTLTDWIVLSNYKYRKGDKHPSCLLDNNLSPLCEHVFDIDAKYIESLGETTKLYHDRTMVMTFDIETYSGNRHTGAVPMGSNEVDVVFMICCTLHWKDSAEPLSQVCLISSNCEPDDRWITVICTNQINLIRSFGILFNAWAPDIIIDFNGGQYDWPFIIEKMEMLDQSVFMFNKMTAICPFNVIKPFQVKQWYVKINYIKAAAGRGITCFHLPGCVPIDSRIICMQNYPTSEKSSLNYFLTLLGLDSKADMAYSKMFDIYENDDAVLMRHVAHYCVIDARRCQEIMVRENAIASRREVGTVSYTSLYDGIYYAGSHKVWNLIMSSAIADGFVCSTKRTSTPEAGEKTDKKYIGAYVIAPEKGLEEDYPTTGLDFASLYPSLIMAYNLSPEKFVSDESTAIRLLNSGYDLHCVEFEYENKTLKGWFVRHDNIESNLGLYPKILINLGNKRIKLKKSMNLLCIVKEHVELLLSRIKKSSAVNLSAFKTVFKEEYCELLLRSKTNNVDVSTRLSAMTKFINKHGGILNINFNAYDAYLTNYKEICFQYSAIYSKQFAAKVFMNTLYGETGNINSPFFMIYIACGVTTAGRYNLQLVDNFTTANGFKTKYGDTDSLYLTCNSSCYSDALALYEQTNKNKEDYELFCCEKVRITMKEITNLRNLVNNYLKNDNGTEYLKMNYEEVLFPVVFTGKKKYYGIAHIKEPNFHPQKLFIKGIDVIKRGQTVLSKVIGKRIMDTSMKLRRPDSVRISLLNIVKNIVSDAILNRDQWVYSDFIQTATWKPEKDNKSVQIFMKRMRDRHDMEIKYNIDKCESEMKCLLYTQPPGGESFNFVIVKVDVEYDVYGKKISNSRRGDKMEYSHIANDQNMELDIPYYINNYVVGLCARFINYETQFQHVGIPSSKNLDEISQNNAKKYLTKFIKSLIPETNNNNNNRDTIIATRFVKNTLNTVVGNKNTMFLKEGILGCKTFLTNSNNSIKLLITDDIIKMVVELPDAHISELLSRFNISPQGFDVENRHSFKLFYKLTGAIDGYRTYTSTFSRLFLSALSDQWFQTVDKLDLLIPLIVDLASRYKTNINAKLKSSTSASFSDTDRILLNNLRNIWNKLVVIQKSIKYHKILKEKIEIIKNLTRGIIRQEMYYLDVTKSNKAIVGNKSDPFRL